MDFLDPAKKRAHTIRLYVGYALVVIAIALASLILLFQSYGYDLDRKTGQVIQNGMLFLDAHPESADIIVNGSNKGKTATRLALPAGSYNVELQRGGYRSWKRSFNLDGGSIERLVYPFLFPEKLTIKDTQLYASSPSLATISPDRHWLMVLQPSSMTAFDVFDANNPDQPPVTLNLPVDLLTKTAGGQNLTLGEWSTDNRHVLLKHRYDDKDEFIMVDRETPTSSLNINKHLSINPTQVTLRDKRYDQLYVYDAKTQALQRADVRAKQVTPFLNGVINYKTHDSDTVLFATVDKETPDKITAKLFDNDKTYTLHSYANGTSLALDVARFENHWYMAIGPQRDGHVYIYKDPLDALKSNVPTPLLPATALKIDQPQTISFSANARFIAAQNGNRFAIYDIETNRRHYYELGLKVAADQFATWMDGHRLLLNQDGKVIAFDYDGINQQTLSPIVAGSTPLFDRDYNRLYTVAPSVVVPDKTALTTTALKVSL